MKHALKGILVVVVLGAVFFAGWQRYRAFLTEGMRPTEATIKLNEMEVKGVPDFVVKDIHGKDVRLSDFKDRAIIINFWASWCDPCIAEFPSMMRLIEFFNGQVLMIAISADHTEADLNAFLKTFNAEAKKDLIIVWDKERKLAEQFGTEVLPESYILGKGNKLIRKIAGSENWFTPEAVQLFQEILTLTENDAAGAASASANAEATFTGKSSAKEDSSAGATGGTGAGAGASGGARPGSGPGANALPEKSKKQDPIKTH